MFAYFLIITLFLTTWTEGAFYLTIYVVSAPRNLECRQTIRKTWGMWCSKICDLKFVLGRNATYHDALQHENFQHKDLIEGDFIDDYYNLTMKSALIIQRGNHSLYSFKTDDDSYVDVPKLIRFLRFHDAEGDPVQYGGLVRIKVKPRRDVTSRHYVSTQLWPENVYPTFAVGAGYLMSKQLTSCLHSKLILDHSLANFPLEDVFVGILASRCRVKPLRMNNLYVTPSHSSNRSHIDSKQLAYSQEGEWICVHKVNVTQMVDIHKRLMHARLQANK